MSWFISSIMCISFLVYENILVSDGKGTINYIKSISPKNTSGFLNYLKNISSGRSRSPIRQNPNIEVTHEEPVGEHINIFPEENRTRQFSYYSDRKRKYVKQATNSLENEVNKDETIFLDFNEKERKDGFKRTVPKQYPYAVLVLVRIRYSNVADVCSGSLLTPRWVLTAAHCFDEGARLEVSIYAGGNSLEELLANEKPSTSQLRKVDIYYKHPKHNKEEKNCDIAVAKVVKPFKMTSSVNTVPLGKRQWTHSNYKACVLTGFGKVYFEKSDPEDRTRKTNYLEVKTKCRCLEGTGWENKVMCSKPREDFGLCSGDSGGGLVCNGVVVAIAFSVLELADIENCNVTTVHHCAMNNSLSLFTETGPYLDWIDSKLNRASANCSLYLVVISSCIILLLFLAN